MPSADVKDLSFTLVVFEHVMLCLQFLVSYYLCNPTSFIPFIAFSRADVLGRVLSLAGQPGCGL